MKFNLHIITFILPLLLCIGWTSTPCLAQSTSITVVSDTTDTIQILANDSALMVANIDDAQDIPSWWHFFVGDNAVVNTLLGLTAGSITVLSLLFVFAFLLAPVLLIILLIYLIMKSSKRKRQAPYYTDNKPNYTNASPVTPERKPIDWEKEKDRLIMRIAIAIGVGVFLWAYGNKFLLLLTFIYLCIQIAKFFNIRRAQKRDENNFEL